jgi:serine/threonine-protein kinase HipA
MPAESLPVWLGDNQVAVLEKRAWNDLRCRYTAAALERWPLNSPVLSCSLLLGPRPMRALPFLRGLLPEGQALATLAARAGVSVNDTFELLARYGRDIAGALVFAEDAPDESAWGIEPYDDESLAEEIGSLDDHPLGVHDDSELSLAGLQNKLLLVRRPDGTWARPLHGYPSTHILKVEDRRFPRLAALEADCLSLAHHAGLSSVDPHAQTIGGIPCVVVRRFDRVESPQGIRRVHQEDLCQALAIDPGANRGRAKYQRGGGGGPGLRDAASLLDLYAAEPAVQLRRLVAVTAFTVAIGNADAHGKNIAFVHPRAGEIELAPLYDVVPTIMWPTLRRELAMSVNGRFGMDEISLEHISAEGVSWALPERDVANAAIEVLRSLRAAVDGAVGVSDELAHVVSARVESLLAGDVAGA